MLFYLPKTPFSHLRLHAIKSTTRSVDAGTMSALLVWMLTWMCIFVFSIILLTTISFAVDQIFVPEHWHGGWRIFEWTLRGITTGLTNTLALAIFAFAVADFRSRWRMSRRPWYPLRSRGPDSLSPALLCEQCHSLTTGSKLIMGSSSYFTPIMEWHKFSDRRNFWSRFATTDELPSDLHRPCHLCRILWSSMSSSRRQALDPGSDPTATRQGRVLPAHKHPNAGLRIKIWEERPLSPYTYAQLFWDAVAVGSRILIHREELFANRMSKASLCEHS